MKFRMFHRGTPILFYFFTQYQAGMYTTKLRLWLLLHIPALTPWCINRILPKEPTIAFRNTLAAACLDNFASFVKIDYRKGHPSKQWVLSVISEWFNPLYWMGSLGYVSKFRINAKKNQTSYGYNPHFWVRVTIVEILKLWHQFRHEITECNTK